MKYTLSLRRRKIRILTASELSIAHGGRGNATQNTGRAGPCGTSNPPTAKTK